MIRDTAEQRVPTKLEEARGKIMWSITSLQAEGNDSRSIEASVLIVGAGPVGLTLAMDLASRGVDVTVAEIRHAGEPPNVKCNQVSARSMEIFRRLGIVRNIRETGLLADYRNDVACCVSTTGTE